MMSTRTDVLESSSRLRRRGAALVAGALVGALVLSSCAPEGATDGTETEEQTETSPAESPDAGEETPPSEDETDEEAPEDEEPEEPEYVLEDGFWRANTLPDPVAEMVVQTPSRHADGEQASAKMQVLSLDSDGDYSRLVLGWLEPEEGDRIRPETISAMSATMDTDPYKPWVRLIDREADELIEPLRADGRSFDFEAEPDVEDLSGDFEQAVVRANCICSQASTGANQEGSSTYLMFIDFPTPESESVDVLAGQWVEPLEDVPVSEGDPFQMPDDDLSGFVFTGPESEPPATYGAGALYERRTDLSARSQSLTGVTTVVDQETQEVSLPADVLFEFGEDSLSSEASSIISDAAEKLNAEAADQTVIVEGHTDNVDGHDINQPLSESRAEAVAEEIEPLLDEDISLETEGHSFDQPLAPNEDAEGNDLPENRELNRRVSFRYNAVDEDSGTEIDLGYEEIEEVAESEETDTADGALASYVLQPGEEDESELEVRFDIIEAEQEDGTVSMKFAIADPSGDDYERDAFGYSEGQAAHFGPNPYFRASFPTAADITLIDEEDDHQHFPVTAGPLNCLCTEVTADAPGLGAEPAPMFAEFRLPEDLSDSLTLRIADSNEITLPDSVKEELAQ